MVFSQDDPGFPDTVPLRESDLGLDVSHRLRIEIVPTLIRFERGREVARTYGWDRREWERLTGLTDLGPLPALIDRGRPRGEIRAACSRPVLNARRSTLPEMRGCRGATGAHCPRIAAVSPLRVRIMR